MSSRGTLRHVLSSYGSLLHMYTWHHNRVFAILAELTETQCRVAIEQPYQDPNTCISFLQEGEPSPWQVSKPQRQQVPAATKDWKMAADLKEAVDFSHHIVHTQERPDIMIWSNTVKHVIIVELTVPWERNMEEDFERKKLHYENLFMECEDKGWVCQMISIDVGCCAFISQTTTSYLTRLGQQTDGGPHSSFKQQQKGLPAGSGTKSERAPHHDKIALLALFPPLPNTLPHPCPPSLVVRSGSLFYS